MSVQQRNYFCPSGHIRFSLRRNLALVILILLVLGCGCSNSSSRNQQNEATVNLTANNTSSQTPIALISPTPPPPSALSSEDSLTLGKKALSDGNLSAARGHLSAIPKEAKEFASAKQYLATVERREKRKAVEDELNSVESEQAGVEQTLDATEDYSDEGTLKKGIYLNALKRKGQLQLRRIELERKLKRMP